jgi:hypothetical protein
MPFDYEARDGIVRVRFYGRVTEQDLVMLADTARKADDWSKGLPHRIVDWTHVESFDIGYTELAAFAQTRKQDKLKIPIKVAHLVSSQVEFGLMRIYQTINENPQIEVRILKTVGEAEAWFAEGGTNS